MYTDHYTDPNCYTTSQTRGSVIRHHFIELDKIINKIGNSMQTITLINQKGRGGKPSQ
jgi:hypothetical protein